MATDPTWSGLDRRVRSDLAATGTPLWHALVEFLRPQVIVASVASSWRDAIAFEPVEPWWELMRVEGGRRHPYIVKARKVHMVDDHVALVVWGQAGMTPFQLVTNEVRAEIGRAIREALR